jgi:hypothetical protein
MCVSAVTACKIGLNWGWDACLGWNACLGWCSKCFQQFFWLWLGTLTARMWPQGSNTDHSKVGRTC